MAGHRHIATIRLLVDAHSSTAKYGSVAKVAISVALGIRGGERPKVRDKEAAKRQQKEEPSRVSLRLLRNHTASVARAVRIDQRPLSGYSDGPSTHVFSDAPDGAHAREKLRTSEPMASSAAAPVFLERLR
jgi:hypothetical protein